LWFRGIEWKRIDLLIEVKEEEEEEEEEARGR
jgi:hypothetical protein